MADHTKGPRAVVADEDEGWTVNAADAIFDTVAVISAQPTPGEELANARLIASAPDLLEALECLLPGLVLDLRYASEDDDKEAMRHRIKTVTDAIAKTVVSSPDPSTLEK